MAGAKQTSTGLSWRSALVVTVVTIAIATVVALSRDDIDHTVVPPPTSTQRTETVPILARAHDSQGVCYGWRLTRGYGEPISVGSNLGDGVPVVDDPRCPRWVEVVGEVTYTLESSEADDRATVDVAGSADFPATDLLLIERGLERFDLDRGAFIADPGAAVTRAAVALPLLVAERQAAEFVPVAAGAPAATPTALPAAGNDLWRDRGGWLIGAAVLLLITVLLVTVGLVQRRRQRVAPAVLPAPHAGLVTSARTRGRP